MDKAQRRDSTRGRPVLIELVLGAGMLLAGAGAAMAQVTSPPTRPAASPARAPGPAGQPAAGSPPAGAPSPGTPQIIRPTATLGPAAPGDAPSPAGATQAVAGAGAGAGGIPRLAAVARYRSIGKPDTVMFDAPSDKAKKIFLAPQGMPVEILSVLRTWVKVRDPLGDLAWVNRDDLTDRRMIMATTVAALRREAAANAPAWFSVDRGVVLELLEERPVNGLLKVRYAEGQVGFIQPDQVWGM